MNTVPLSADDKKAISEEKFRQGLPQLRVVFLVMTILYGSFGFLDLVLIDEHLPKFLLLRFGIVVPMFLAFFFLTYCRSIIKFVEPLLIVNFVFAGAGISVMLILHPENFSYYGGMFMVIFSGFFLLKLRTSYALLGGVLNLLFYGVGYALFHNGIPFDIAVVMIFLLGTNIIGLFGNLQLEQMNTIRYIQKKEIEEKNHQLEIRVVEQKRELLQIEKAINSASDAVAVLDPEGNLTYHNHAFGNLLGDALPIASNELDLTKIIDAVTRSGSWQGEVTLCTLDRAEITTLLQADAITDENSEFLGLVVTYKDITERKDAEKRMRYMSFHDGLTSLHNRAYLDEWIRITDEEQLPISVIMADLNGLKLVNDTYGHFIGDDLLRSAAKAISTSCRENDVIVRCGGDEFVVLMPNTTFEQASCIADAIATNSAMAKVEDVPVSMAIGVACQTSATDFLPDTIKAAEDSMYRRKLTESRSTKNTVLSALRKTLQEKSFETDLHAQGMQEIARAIGDRIGLPADELARLDLLITLHDIGKINISEEILTKSGPLTIEERSIIERHPETGYRIAGTTEEFSHVATEILSHHERWDGSGYPRGLKEEQIPLLARIATIADAYEVMSCGRPYKKAMPKDKIIEEFRRCRGTQFDPKLVDVFFEIVGDAEIVVEEKAKNNPVADQNLSCAQML